MQYRWVSPEAALALLQSVASTRTPPRQTLLGNIAFAEGAYKEAEGHCHVARAPSRQQGVPWSEPLTGDGLGIGPTLNRLGDLALAGGYVGQAQL